MAARVCVRVFKAMPYCFVDSTVPMRPMWGSPADIAAK